MKDLLIICSLLFGMNSCGQKLDVKNTTEKKMEDQNIKLRIAPELRVDQWIDKNGNKIGALKLSDFEGKYKVIYCFQHWCPGCHSLGLPSLKELVDEFKGVDKIQFLAVQTVFEGADANTYDKILETQKKYDLKIPFGHDPGVVRSTIMEDYGTGGTPWFIFINQNNEIEFADFHINVSGAKEYLKGVLNDGK